MYIESVYKYFILSVSGECVGMKIELCLGLESSVFLDIIYFFLIFLRIFCQTRAIKDE